MKPIDVLLVEDNPGDVRLMHEVFKEVAAGAAVNVVTNGVEALAYLRRAGAFATATRPDIVILDWNLPLKNGGEVLAEIKADAALKSIPVVVLTTSGAEEHVAAAYSAHANCYIAKPSGLDEFFEVGRRIHEFWWRTAALPVFA